MRLKPPHPLFLTLTLALSAGLAPTGAAHADAPTLHWPLPLPADLHWRIVELREGNGIRHEEYVPQGQGAEDYRDRLLVQRFGAQDMSPETYLGHISSGLAGHCSEFAAGGPQPAGQDGLPGATLSLFCGRFEQRPYGYVIVQKVMRDGDFLFVVEREWRLPAFTVEAGNLAASNFATPEEAMAWRRSLRYVQLWLAERVNPAAVEESPAPAMPSTSTSPTSSRTKARRASPAP